MAIAERYLREEERERVIRRQNKLRCVAIAATGLVLPQLLMIVAWMAFWLVDIMPLARSRLAVMLTPSWSELPGTIVVLVLFAAPFIVQAFVSARLLNTRGSRRLRAAWRVRGCFAGTCLATLVVFLLIVPFDAAWVSPGFGVPTHLLGTYYGAALVLGGIGGWIGRHVGLRIVPRGGPANTSA